MKNIKGDFLFVCVLLIWILVLSVPSSRTAFLAVTGAHPYFGGFLKFSILATMGDLLGARIIKGKWIIPKGFIFKAMLWGFIGMAITLLFTIFTEGSAAAQASGKLPFAGSKIAKAFFGSAAMNLTFGPMLYIYHKFGDLFIDFKYERKGQKVKIADYVDSMDWHTMVGFSWLITCPLIWIPCHTLVFLLPEEYRVLASAALSILLGIIVAFSKKRSTKADSPTTTS